MSSTHYAMPLRGQPLALEQPEYPETVIPAARATSVGNTKVKVNRTDITTTSTNTEQGNALSGSGHYGDVPPSPAAFAASPAFGVRCDASAAEQQKLRVITFYFNTQALSPQDSRVPGLSSVGLPRMLPRLLASRTARRPA